MNSVPESTGDGRVAASDDARAEGDGARGDGRGATSDDAPDDGKGAGSDSAVASTFTAVVREGEGNAVLYHSARPYLGVTWLRFYLFCSVIYGCFVENSAR